jgi:hypothetical protein
MAAAAPGGAGRLTKGMGNFCGSRRHDPNSSRLSMPGSCPRSGPPLLHAFTAYQQVFFKRRQFRGHRESFPGNTAQDQCRKVFHVGIVGDMTGIISSFFEIICLAGKPRLIQTSAGILAC